jgi:hypothetical protein
MASSRLMWPVPVLLAALVGCAGDDGADGAGDETASETQADAGDSEGSGDGDGDSSGDGDGDGDGDTGEPNEPGPAGIFVAVGDGGRRASSTDGISWDELIGSGTIDTQAEEGQEDTLRAVAVGGEPPVVIAVGGGGGDWNGNTMIMRSSDALSWDEDLVGGVDGLDRRKLSAVAWIDDAGPGGAGAFIAGGHQTHILRSDDRGLTWTRVYPEHHSSTTVFGIAGHGGEVVLVGAHKDAWDAPKQAYVHRSVDGGQTFGAPSYFGNDGDDLVAIASNLERYVAVGPVRCLGSDDGVDWQPCGLAGIGYGSVSFTNNRFVVTYLDGVSTSVDGQTWSVHVESANGVPAEIVFGNGVYAGVRFYDRGISDSLGEWSFVSHGGFPLRDLAFLRLE